MVEIKGQAYFASMGFAGWDGWGVVPSQLACVALTMLEWTYISAFKDPVALAVIVDLETDRDASREQLGPARLGAPGSNIADRQAAGLLHSDSLISVSESP